MPTCTQKTSRPQTRPLLVAALFLVVCPLGAWCQSTQKATGSADLSHWPEGRSPLDIGHHVAEHFVVSPHMQGKPIIYPEFCAWYGALTIARVTGDQTLTNELIQRFQPMLTPEQIDLIPKGRHVDESIFGILPLEIYQQTHGKKYLEMGLAYADRQWDTPRHDGLSGETRFWIDDMYMITILQLQAFRASEDRKYLDRAALEMSAYLDKLQEPNGLFFHAPDVPVFWARGNGWVAAGMTELLSSMPDDHPMRPRILKGYHMMMAALIERQGSDGMWRELLDDDTAWPETSSSAMFTFALVTGVKHGWLEASSYSMPARRAWIALSGYVDQNWDLTNICEGTNKVNDRNFYLMRKRKTGDFHGQAPLMWAAAALLR